MRMSATGLYKIALLLYPEAFRTEFGQEMAETFEALPRDLMERKLAR